MNSPGTWPVGDVWFGVGHPVEVNVIVCNRSFGRFQLDVLVEVELQIDGHLTVQK